MGHNFWDTKVKLAPFLKRTRTHTESLSRGISTWKRESKIGVVFPPYPKCGCRKTKICKSWVKMGGIFEDLQSECSIQG